MHTIWKFALKNNDSQVLELPLNSKLLSIETQNENIVVYALVNTEQTEKESKDIKVFETGKNIPDLITQYTFLGTAKLYNGSFMYHVFYK